MTTNSRSYWRYGYVGFDWGFPDYSNDPLVKQIKEETIEYFTEVFKGKYTMLNLSDALFRQALLPDDKRRVVEFMKNRLKFYNENGFVMPKE